MRRKNIVIVMSDEQSWNTLGCHGGIPAVTPNIDKLAADGISLDRCYATYPLCCPSRASLWTGLMPHNHQVTKNWCSIREDLKDGGLVSNFKDAGYHTIYTGKWHVPGTTPSGYQFEDISAIPAVIEGKDRGRFIEEYRQYARSLGYDLHETHIENLTHRDIRKLKEPGKAPCGQSDIKLEHFLETWQTERFLEALGRRPEGHPFLAVCSYNAPHFPLLVPAPYDTWINPDDVVLPENFRKGMEGKPGEVAYSRYMRHLEKLDEREWRRFIAHYLGLCALIDKQVGDIVDYLKMNGLYEDTIVVFLSDHGDMMGAHGLVEKGFPLHYEEALRVPLIIANAGETVRSSSEAFVSLIDLLPTLGDLTGVTVKQTIDGRSFANLMNDPDRNTHREYILAETFKIGKEDGEFKGGEAAGIEQFNPETDSFNLSIRTGTRKYIFRYKDIEELYDLETDPYENDNAVFNPAYAEKLADMRRLLMREMNDSCPFLAELVAKKWSSGGPCE